MASSRIGKQAIVIGAGMGGLAATGALAGHFEKVIVLDRDSLPSEPVPRAGTPQARHLHGLLPGGQRALSELFPHFEEDLAEAGAVPLKVASELRMEMPGLGPMPQRDFGGHFYCISRPLLELVTRRQAERLANVTIRPECRVLEIVATPDGETVTGVTYEAADGRKEFLPADLVIDASGRAAPTIALLGSTGRATPDEVVIEVDLHYTTGNFVIPDDASTDWRGIATHPHAPERSRGGYMLPIEGNRWVLTLTGRLGERPPADPDGFMAYAQTLETRTIYDAIKHAERVGGFERFAFTASTWRRFDRLAFFPRHLLPLGDSICRFNPVYGQGMTVASQEARLLRRLLRDRAANADPLDGLAGTFLAETLPLVQAPWNMSAMPDLVYPETRGERPADFQNQLKYNGALTRLAIRDPAIHKLMVEVQQLLVPPSALQDPAVDRLVRAELAQMATA
ncbi:MAG TPA: FAD-dependent monooxygenase [Aliidongia sp.]|nr:FAD-dependent monooxygenase [Aliidongia sp.]